MGETMARIVLDPIASGCKSFYETCLDSVEWDKLPVEGKPTT